MSTPAGLVIVHGGQTGVDRGAHYGARAAHLSITGYMPQDARDEEGLIPQSVAAWLMRCPESGLPARTEQNVRISHALLLVVEDCERGPRSPGSRLTLGKAKYRELPWKVADPTTDPAVVHAWVADVIHARRHRGHMMTRVMVAGPRASKWRDGEATARAIVAALADLAIVRDRD